MLTIHKSQPLESIAERVSPNARTLPQQFHFRSSLAHEIPLRPNEQMIQFVVEKLLTTKKSLGSATTLCRRRQIGALTSFALRIPLRFAFVGEVINWKLYLFSRKVPSRILCNVERDALKSNDGTTTPRWASCFTSPALAAVKLKRGEIIFIVEEERKEENLSLLFLCVNVLGVSSSSSWQPSRERRKKRN